MNQHVVDGFISHLSKLAQSQYDTSQHEQPSTAATMGKWLGGAALLGTAVAMGKSMIPQSEEAKAIELLKGERAKELAEFTSRLSRVR